MNTHYETFGYYFLYNYVRIHNRCNHLYINHPLSMNIVEKNNFIHDLYIRKYRDTVIPLLAALQGYILCTIPTIHASHTLKNVAIIFYLITVFGACLMFLNKFQLYALLKRWERDSKYLVIDKILYNSVYLLYNAGNVFAIISCVVVDYFYYITK